MVVFIVALGMLVLMETLLYAPKNTLNPADVPKAIESRHEVFDCAVYDQHQWESRLIKAGIMDRADRVVCDDKLCNLCKTERDHRQSLLNQAREARSQEFWRGERLKKEVEAYRDKMNKYAAQVLALNKMYEEITVDQLLSGTAIRVGTIDASTIQTDTLEIRAGDGSIVRYLTTPGESEC
jgi:hypothetical protein